MRSLFLGDHVPDFVLKYKLVSIHKPLNVDENLEESILNRGRITSKKGLNSG